MVTFCYFEACTLWKFADEQSLGRIVSFKTQNFLVCSCFFSCDSGIKPRSNLGKM
jgi:hypothetical protein